MEEGFLEGAGFQIGGSYGLFLGGAIIILLFAFLYMIMSSQKKAVTDGGDGNDKHFIRMFVGIVVVILFIAFYTSF